MQQPEQSSSRYIHSVSDLLYSTDEIEYLLVEDIKDLEPKSYKPEEIQVECLSKQEWFHSLGLIIFNVVHVYFLSVYISL